MLLVLSIEFKKSLLIDFLNLKMKGCEFHFTLKAEFIETTLPHLTERAFNIGCST